MKELAKVHSMLSTTKHVKDKSVHVDTFMEDCPMQIVETVPYEIKINIDVANKSSSVDVFTINSRVQQQINSLKPPEPLKKLDLESTEQKPFQLQNRVFPRPQGRLHISHSFIYSFKKLN